MIFIVTIFLFLAWVMVYVVIGSVITFYILKYAEQAKATEYEKLKCNEDTLIFIWPVTVVIIIFYTTKNMVGLFF